MTRQVDDEVCDQLRVDLRQFLASRPDVSMLDLTHHTKFSDCAGKSFLNGNLPGGRAVVGEFRRVLGLARAGEIFPPGGGRNGRVTISEEPRESIRRIEKNHNFYETATAKKISEVLDFCAQNCALGVITGDYGCGKSRAIKEWRERSQISSLIYEFTIFGSGNMVEFIRDLSRLLGLETPPGSQTGGVMFRAVVERLREAPTLLVLDQAETVRARVFQCVRQLFDATRDYGCGVVILAAPILLIRMTTSRVADLGAISSRVGIWAPLAGLSRSEMAGILKAEGVADVDEGAFDCWARLVNGSMRRLESSIALLRVKHAGRRVTEKTILMMASHLWGVQGRSTRSCLEECGV
jgi:hypothetical protein